MADQPNPVIANIRTYLDTNSTKFYEMFYPRNGTIQIDTGETKTVDGPVGLRRPMQVVWITVGCMVLILAIVAGVGFVARHLHEQKVEDAKRPLY